MAARAREIVVVDVDERSGLEWLRPQEIDGVTPGSRFKMSRGSPSADRR
jgi:hypothetical protein